MTLILDGKPTAAVGTSGGSAIPDDYSGWHLPGGDNRLQVVSLYDAWGAGKCFRHEVRNNDQFNPASTTEAERAEVRNSYLSGGPDTGDYDPEQGSNTKAQQRIRYYGMRLMLATVADASPGQSWVSPANWTNQGFAEIHQMKPNIPSYSPVRFIEYRNHASLGLVFGMRGGNSSSLGAYSYGPDYRVIYTPAATPLDVWVDLFWIALIRDNATGYVKLWKKLKTTSTWTSVFDTSSSTHPTTYRWTGGGAAPSFADADNRFGSHRDHDYTQTHVFYTGGLAVADTQADIETWFGAPLAGVSVPANTVDPAVTPVGTQPENTNFSCTTGTWTE